MASPRVGMRTPWGAADYVKSVAPGIWIVSTPGHGGYKLDRKRNAMIYPSLRRRGGWYEEDVDWGAVALTFPDLFSAENLKGAESGIRAYHPDAWEEIYGRELQPGESYKRDQETFAERHANDYVGVAAVSVGRGRVKVWGVRGGRLPSGQYASDDEGQWLVTSEQYRSVPLGQFVIDESKHERIA